MDLLFLMNKGKIMLLEKNENGGYLKEFKNRIKFLDEIIDDKIFLKKLVFSYNSISYLNMLDFILAKRPEIIKNKHQFREEYNRIKKELNNDNLLENI